MAILDYFWSRKENKLYIKSKLKYFHSAAGGFISYVDVMSWEKLGFICSVWCFGCLLVGFCRMSPNWDSDCWILIFFYFSVRLWVTMDGKIWFIGHLPFNRALSEVYMLKHLEIAVFAKFVLFGHIDYFILSLLLSNLNWLLS